jgi:putative ABC transport system substrate-binding protein
VTFRNYSAVAAILMVLLLGSPLGTDAQTPGRVYRIGILLAAPISPNPPLDAFLHGLRDLDYVHGRNVVIEYRSTDPDKLDRLPALAADLVSRKVDIIFAIATGPAEAAKGATKTIPIVFALASDPVNAGLVASLGRPGGNLTGLTNTSPDLSAKRLQLLKEMLPEITHIALLWNASNSLIARQVPETEVAALALKVQLHVVAVRGPADFETAFSAISKKRVGGLVVIQDVLTATHRERIAALAAKNRLPMISEFRNFADAGALLTYGPNGPEAGRRAAYFVDKILKGAKPGDLPVEQPTKFELVINLKTAETLGLTIPPALLLRANDIIE